jgi:hypothetical protein
MSSISRFPDDSNTKSHDKPFKQKPVVGWDSNYLGIFLNCCIFLGDHVIDLPGIFNQISCNTLALRVLYGFGFTFEKT